MKSMVIALAAAASLTAGAAAAATPTACEAYARAASADDEGGLVETKSVDPLKTKLSATQLGMVQTTILVGNPSQPMSAAKALKEFVDAENDNSAAGDLDYSELKVGTRTITFARVTYYPGDNEYGGLFKITTYEGKESADLIGLIQDGDTVCLTYPNID